MTTTGRVMVEDVEFNSPVVQRLLSDWDNEILARSPAFSPGGGSTVRGSDFALPFGSFLVAFREGRRVGCGGVRRLTEGVGELKRVFVSPAGRRLGVGRALLHALEQRARALGYASLRLDTDGHEPAALALFRSLAYRPIDDYNGNPYARYWFEQRLR